MTPDSRLKLSSSSTEAHILQSKFLSSLGVPHAIFWVADEYGQPMPEGMGFSLIFMTFL